MLPKILKIKWGGKNEKIFELSVQSVYICLRSRHSCLYDCFKVDVIKRLNISIMYHL